MSKKTESVVIAAFTEEEAARLTGLSVRQLRSWDRSGFFAPELANENRSLAYSRLFSFKDLVALRVLSSLRNDAGVSLQHLREVKRKLDGLGEGWATTTLYVLKRRVVFDNPNTRAKEEIVSGQGVLQIPLEVVAENMSERVRQWRKRDGEASGRIETKRGIGTIVAGTRIPVSNIKSFSEAGYSIDEILSEYPTLTRTDIEAALNYDRAA